MRHAGSKHPRRVAAIVLSIAAAAVAAGGGAKGAVPLTLDEQRQFNYAFATQIGDGIYSISGRTLTLYTLPLSYTFREAQEGRPGWRLTCPVTFGLYAFEAADIADTTLRQTVATTSFVPGFQLLVRATPKWILKPYVEAGWAWDLTGDADATLYSAGVAGRAAFAAGRFDLTLGDDLNHTVVHPLATGGRDSLAVLESAVEARHLLRGAGGSGNADYGLYGVVHAYARESGHPFVAAQGSRLVGEYEAGITFGARRRMRLWKIPLPRLGLGYLFGHDLRAFRIVFGTPATSLEP